MEVQRDAPESTEIVPQSSPKSSPKKYRKTQHRGVRILKPDVGKHLHRLRYRDPETGRIVTPTMSADDNKNADTRTAAAIRIHKTLRRRNEAIGEGAVPHHQAGWALAAAVKHYYDKHDHPHTTKVDYQQATNTLIAWGKVNGVMTVRQLTPGKLREYSLDLAKMPKMVRRKGGKRGEMIAKGKRSKPTISKYRRNTGIVLNGLRKLQVVRLSRDEIAESLERKKSSTKRKGFLQPKEIQKLIECCKRHDATMYKMDRKGRRDRPRYTPILPFVYFVLYTGMRVSEALQILASDIVGTDLNIREEVSKTGVARTCDLAISKTLLSMKLAERTGLLFPSLTKGKLAAAKKRLLAVSDCPRWTWHGLRRTCGTFLTCAPGIYGGASAYMSAKQLGHSVVVAEKHYTGVIKIDPKAKTLEEAFEPQPDA